jgi:hypothetical protein
LGNNIFHFVNEIPRGYVTIFNRIYTRQSIKSINQSID